MVKKIKSQTKGLTVTAYPIRKRKVGRILQKKHTWSFKPIKNTVRSAPGQAPEDDTENE